MKKVYQLLNSDLLLGDKEVESKLYVNWDENKVFYITTDLNGENHQYFESTKHPENLTNEERFRVLDYCLGNNNYDKDEIVNYNDLFLQSEFIKQSQTLKEYSLSEEWLNY